MKFYVEKVYFLSPVNIHSEQMFYCFCTHNLTSWKRQSKSSAYTLLSCYLILRAYHSEQVECCDGHHNGLTWISAVSFSCSTTLCRVRPCAVHAMASTSGHAVSLSRKRLPAGYRQSLPQHKNNNRRAVMIIRTWQEISPQVITTYLKNAGK